MSIFKKKDNDGVVADSEYKEVNDEKVNDNKFKGVKNTEGPLPGDDGPTNQREPEVNDETQKTNTGNVSGADNDSNKNSNKEEKTKSGNKKSIDKEAKKQEKAAKKEAKKQEKIAKKEANKTDKADSEHPKDDDENAFSEFKENVKSKFAKNKKSDDVSEIVLCQHTKDQYENIKAAENKMLDDRSKVMRAKWYVKGGTIFDSVGNIMFYCTIKKGKGFIGRCLEVMDFDSLESREERYEEYLYEYFYRKYMNYEMIPFEYPGSEEACLVYNRVAKEMKENEIPESEFKKCIINRDIFNERMRDYKDNIGINPEVIKNEFDIENASARTPDVKGTNADIRCANPLTDEEQKQVKEEELDQGKSNTVKFPTGTYVEYGPNNEAGAIRPMEHKNGYKEKNAIVLEKYPKLQELFTYAERYHYTLLLENTDPLGLITMKVYVPGIQTESMYYIDPGKIRPYYSILIPPVADMEVWDMIVVPFTYYDTYLNQQMDGIDQLFSGAINSTVSLYSNLSAADKSFFHHIKYSGIPESDMPSVINSMLPFTNLLDNYGINVRFEIANYVNAREFTLVCGKAVGLSKFAQGNKAHEGLMLRINIIDEGVMINASGSTSREFAMSLPEGIIDSYDGMESDKISESINEAKRKEEEDKKNAALKEAAEKQKEEDSMTAATLSK